MAMKECPNCGAQARAEWVLCPSCRMNMLEAAVVLGRDHYVAPGDETAPARPPDLTPYELPRRSPVVMAAPTTTRTRSGITYADLGLGLLYLGLAIVFFGGFLPVLTSVGGRSVSLNGTPFGALVTLSASGTLVCIFLKRPRAALWCSYVMAASYILMITFFVVVGLPWNLVDWGIGIPVLMVGVGLSIAGARVWAGVETLPP